ncbi:MAG: hypothetical protein HYR84_02965 [Planctomycetes bacterium]|nr:hypothetical protein [Planctomycetota bacterium]
MPQSWEFYQQIEVGNAYPLYWLCGLGGTTAFVPPGASALARMPLLLNEALYAIPFDQMNAMTVNKMFINLITRSPNGGKVRIGIYQRKKRGREEEKGEEKGSGVVVFA